MGQIMLRKVHGGIIRGKGPWENGVETFTRNDYKWKEWRKIANRGKITADFPIRRYLAGDLEDKKGLSITWSTGEMNSMQI